MALKGDQIRVKSQFFIKFTPRMAMFNMERSFWKLWTTTCWNKMFWDLLELSLFFNLTFDKFKLYRLLLFTALWAKRGNRVKISKIWKVLIRHFIKDSFAVNTVKKFLVNYKIWIMVAPYLTSVGCRKWVLRDTF